MWKETHSGELPREIPSPWGGSGTGEGSEGPWKCLGGKQRKSACPWGKGSPGIITKALENSGQLFREQQKPR